MNYTDLREVKRVIDIDPGNTQEDVKLLLFIEQVSNWFTEYLGTDYTYKTRTQYYKGSGTQKLLLRNRPVYPSPPSPFSAISVTYDSQGFYGASSGAFSSTGATTIAYTYGVDYTMEIDQDDGSSRSGILIRINEYWTKPQVRQAGLLSPFIADDTGSLKIVYTAGYTVDTMPAIIRTAANLAVQRLRYVFPLGMELGSESYEERHVSFVQERRDYIMSLVKPFLFTFRNWTF